MATIADILAAARNLPTQGPRPAAPPLPGRAPGSGAQAGGMEGGQPTSIMPPPTLAQRAIGFAGEKVGVPLIAGMRLLPGGELGYQAARALDTSGRATGAVAPLVEKEREEWARSVEVPKWVPGIGGFQPVRTAMQIAPYALGGAAGRLASGIPAGLMAIGAERGGARGLEQGMAPLDVAATAAMGALEMGNIGGAFQVGGKFTPTGAWRRGLTPTDVSRMKVGMQPPTPPPPGAMQMLGEKVQGWRAGKAVGFPRAKGGVADAPVLGRYGQRPDESLKDFMRRSAATFSPTKHAEIRHQMQSGLYSGVPVPTNKAEWIALAKSIVPAKTAGAIYEVLGQHGGDIFKAALAVGLQEGLARQVAAAVQPSPPGAAPAAAAPAKEPWEMTRDGYVELKAGLGGAQAKRWANVHASFVQSALRAGKPVPPAVLADYPDLARAAPAPAGAEAAPPVGPAPEVEYEIINSRGNRTWKRTFASRAEAQKFLEKKVTSAPGRIQFMVRPVERAGPAVGAEAEVAPPTKPGALPGPVRGPLAPTGAEQAPPEAAMGRALFSPEQLTEFDRLGVDVSGVTADYKEEALQQLGFQQKQEAKLASPDYNAQVRKEEADIERRRKERVSGAFAAPPPPEVARGLTKAEGKAVKPPPALAREGDMGPAYVSPDTMDAAARDWAAGRLYVKAGNFRLKAEGRRRGPIAPYNRELKARGVTSDDLHARAKAMKIEAEGPEPSKVAQPPTGKKAAKPRAPAPPPAPPKKPPTPPEAPAAAAPEPEPKKVPGAEAVEGRVAAARESMLKAVQAGRDKATNRQALLEEAIDRIRQTLRGHPELKGEMLNKALVRIRTAKTEQQRIERAEELLAKAEHQELVRNVRGQMKELRSGLNAMEDPYRGAAAELIDQFQPSEPTAKTVAKLESRKAFLEAHPEAEMTMPKGALQAIERLDKRPLADLSPEELGDLSSAMALIQKLNETKGRLKVGLKVRQLKADLEAGTKEIAKGHAELPSYKRGKGSWVAWLFGRGQLDAFRIAREMGGDEAVMVEYLVRGLHEGEMVSTTWLRKAMEPLLDTLETRGIPFGSRRMGKELGKSVTVNLPTATNWETGQRIASVTLTVDELVGADLDFQDADTVYEIEQAGYAWESQPGKQVTRPGPADRKLMLTHHDQEAIADLVTELGWRDYSDALQKLFGDAERFEAMDKTVFSVAGRHLKKTENYHPRVRNIRLERIEKVPETLSDFVDYFLEQGGPVQARTGTTAAVLGGPATLKYLRHASFASRLIGLAEPIRNAWMILGNPTIKTTMTRHFGEGVLDDLRDHLRFVMGSGLTRGTRLDEAVRRLMEMFTKSVIRIRGTTTAIQPLSTIYASDVLGPKVVAKGYAAFMSHPKQTINEILENSDVFWHRFTMGRITALMSGNVGDAAALYPHRSWMDDPVRWGDMAGIGSLWEAAKLPLSQGGKTPDLAEVDRECQRLINEDGAAPTLSSVYTSGIARAARRQAGYRPFTLLMNQRNRIFNKVAGRVRDVVRNPDDPKAWARLLKTALAVAAGAIMLGIIGGVGAFIRSGGKRKPTVSSVGLVAAQRTIGTSYFVGDAFSALTRMAQRGTSYGVDTGGSALEDIMETGLTGLYDSFSAIDQMASGERYKAGAFRGQRKGPRTLARAAEKLLRFTFYTTGLPEAPLSYLRLAVRGARQGRVASEAGEKPDTENLAWSASGGSASAVEKLKAAGISLTDARVALRRAMMAKGIKAAERVSRLRKLSELWRGAKQAA